MAKKQKAWVREAMARAKGTTAIASKPALSLSTWTHPVTGAVRVYVNGTGEQSGKVWFEADSNPSGYVCRHSGEFFGSSSIPGLSKPAAIEVEALQAVGLLDGNQMGSPTWADILAKGGAK